MIMLGVSNKKLYELLNTGQIDSFREGAARKIEVASIRAYIKRQIAAERRARGAAAE